MISSPVWQVEFVKLHERLPCPFTMHVPGMTFIYPENVHSLDTALYMRRAMEAFRRPLSSAATRQTVQ